MPITVDQIVPWGRSMSEYVAMFALSDSDLNKRILGCGDGPASFNCEMTEQNRSVVSVDPLYAVSGAEIAQRITETYASIVGQLHHQRDDYVWDRFADPDALGRHRWDAMQRFLADFATGLAAGRYRAQSLPILDFADGAFDLALCSHFLFLYTEQLSYRFHRDSILELCRVAHEVRIFPLLDMECRPSRYIEPLQAELTEAGYQVEIHTVPYEFQRGGNQMMRVRAARSA